MSRLKFTLLATVLVVTAAPLAAHAEATEGVVATARDGGALQALPASTPLTPAASDGNVLSRMVDYYKHEWGKAGPDSDPSAPIGRQTDIPPAPVSSPPYPFTDWPFGGATTPGANRPASVDSPLMVGLAPTPLGKWMSDAHIQAYGWVEVGANLSTSKISGGNAPAGYDYNPNTVQMDQTVLYVERTPDTVQKDHIDWGFRVSAIYGVDYRSPVSDGLLSNQLPQSNKN